MGDSAWTHHYAELRDVRLHYVEATPDGEEGDAPLVILLHGFPEFWYSWRHQLVALAEAGYRAVAPDMRGYNLSEKPSGVGAYSLDHLVDDVEELVEHLGAERAHIVGHDWGAAVAWAFAAMRPGRTHRLVICNVPHPARLAQGLRTPRQLRKSWYMAFFQLPVLPELALQAGDFWALRRMFRTDPVRQGAFDDDDIERYVEALSRPGALTSTINYYRAAARGMPREQYRTIEASTLVIWGDQDAYLGAELATPEPQYVPDVRVEHLPDASHWVQVDRPGRVSELMVDFLDAARHRRDG